MSNSYVDYKDKSIRAPDLSLAIAFSIIIRVGKLEAFRDSPVLPFLDGWKKIIRTSAPGAMAFALTGFLETEDGRIALRKIVTAALNCLKDEGEYIEGKRLDDLLYTERHNSEGAHTEEVIEFFHELLALIDS